MIGVHKLMKGFNNGDVGRDLVVREQHKTDYKAFSLDIFIFHTEKNCFMAVDEWIRFRNYVDILRKSYMN